VNNYKTTKLPNGISIVSENIPYVKSFSLGFWFDVGSRDESAKNNGISHFLEHMFFKGTIKRNTQKISDEIESLGGYLNAFTSKEHTCYYGRGLAQHIDKTFEVLADMLQNSKFTQKDINKEAQVVIDELKDIEDSPEELIFDKFENNIFSGSSLKHPIIGNEKNIASFNHSSLVDYIEKKYNRSKFVIVAVGAVDHDRIVELTEKYIYKIHNGKGKRKEIGKLKPIKNQTINKEVQQVHQILGIPTFGYNNDNRRIINVLSHILGEGSSSRLFQSLREKNGIAYQINSFLNSFYDISSFGIYCSTSLKSAERAESIIMREFDKLRNKKVSQKELKRAKEYIKGNLLMNLESTTNRMLRIGATMLYYGKIKPVDKTVQEIDSVKSEEILDFANKYLKKNSIVKVVIRAED